jgi:uncharacterized membrane protein (UPF0127 family)
VFFRRAVSRRGALAALLLTVGALPACKNAGVQKGVPAAPAGPAASVVVDTGGRRVSFRVELARTPGEHERGLMYRQRLAADAGMLFVFDRPSLQTFWMKNTLLPLDMIFIGGDRRIVGVVSNAEPLTLTARGVEEPSQYVLEIGGGLAARLGIQAGQPIDLVGVSDP